MEFLVHFGSGFLIAICGAWLVVRYVPSRLARYFLSIVIAGAASVIAYLTWMQIFWPERSYATWAGEIEFVIKAEFLVIWLPVTALLIWVLGLFRGRQQPGKGPPPPRDRNPTPSKA